MGKVTALTNTSMMLNTHSKSKRDRKHPIAVAAAPKPAATAFRGAKKKPAQLRMVAAVPRMLPISCQILLADQDRPLAAGKRRHG
ncbi:MAG: hypothetical protein J0I62_07365, partial [Microbacterium sp.]|nr:hypothetical protein [Microbacterium sp.]